MSASLVGSEMCIRDRLTRGGQSVRRPSLGPPRTRPQPARPAGGPNSGTPVSYTHLTLPTICSV
eukprot:10455778-Alexandrium_andersonii.AAC.1